MNPPGLAFLQHVACELALAKWLAAGNGHSTTGGNIEFAIGQHVFEHLLGCHFRAHQHERPSIARLGASSTSDAPLAPEDVLALDYFVCLPLAPRGAGSASDAPIWKNLQLGLWPVGFRVVAPDTPHLAPFEEDRRTDSRAVVYGKALDVTHNAGGHDPFLRVV
jgi:hypothetical protein